MPQSPDIGKNSDRGIFDFPISGQSLIKENRYNPRISDDIDMKVGPVTKLDKRNKTTLKKFDDDVMSENCDIIDIFFNFWSIWSSPVARFRTQHLQMLCFQ